MIRQREPGAGLWWGTLTAAATVLLLPLLITDVPPILDYPNHLARLVLLHAGPDDPVLGRFFEPHWTIIPNLAIDVIGTPLLGLLPVHVAGRCMLGGILLLNLAGVICLHRALFGRRSYWPIASVLMAYNSTFLLGFLNWQIGSGLAMLAAAGWMTWRERFPLATIAAASLASVLLFFCHLMGVAFFLVLIGSAELRAMWGRTGTLVRVAGLVPAVMGPVALSLQTSLRDAPASTHWMSLYDKSVQVASPFINYVLPLDLFSVGVVYGGIVLGLAAGWLIVAPRAIAAFLVVVAGYVVLPFDLMSASFLDTRVAIMVGWLAFAVVDPVFPRVVAWRVVGAACAMLFLVRMGVVADAWTEHRRDLAEFRSVIAAIPPGSTVYMTNIPQEEAPAYWDAGPRSRRLSNTLRADYHLPALVFIERGAFWPVLFANPAQQPIRLRPAYAALARTAHFMPAHAALMAEPERAEQGLPAFDFVLLLEAGAAGDLSGFVPQCLSLEKRTGFAALFRVTCTNTNRP
jgi:hypothetical protein